MSINISQLIQSMLDAATGAAKGHGEDLKNYLQSRAKLIAEGAAAIASARLQGKSNADGVIDGGMGGSSARAEEERDTASSFSIHLLNFAGGLRGERLNHRRAMHCAKLIQRGGVAILRVNQRSEFFRGRGVLQPRCKM